MEIESLKKYAGVSVLMGGLATSGAGAAYEYIRNEFALSLILATDVILFTYVLFNMGWQQGRESALKKIAQAQAANSPDLAERLLA